MGLPKGRTNNPIGRPGGIPNKLTSGLRERVSNILDRNFDLEAIERDLEQLDPEKRLSFMIKLLEFSIPKMQSMKLEADLKSELKTTNMTEQQYNELIEAARKV